MQCSVERCENKAVARTWCPKHYLRWSTHGDPLYPSQQDLSLVERFWQKVQRSDGCWLWTGAKRGDGYGAFQNGRQQFGAHRFSYLLVHGEIPEGMVVMHSCDVPLCVNPDHLLLGTDAENQADASRKGRKLPGSANPQSKLTEDKVVELRRRYSEGGVSQKQLAVEYGVSHALISFIVTRRAWKHVP